MQKQMSEKMNKAFSQLQNTAVSGESGVGTSSSGPKGSMTVEAALALPIFIFFMLSVLYIFDIIHLQTQSYQAMHQVGNRIAHTAYKHRERYEDSGIVSLNFIYPIKPYLLWQDWGHLAVVQIYRGHAWVGYDLGGGGEAEGQEDKEEVVHITETGTVYHLTLDCSHIRLSISPTSEDAVELLRNEGGAKYYPCERCPPGDGGTLYVTSQGNRYHSDVNCSGLKRTVTSLPLNKAIEQGYRACSRCGVR